MHIKIHAAKHIKNYLKRITANYDAIDAMMEFLLHEDSDVFVPPDQDLLNLYLKDLHLLLDSIHQS